MTIFFASTAEEKFPATNKKREKKFNKYFKRFLNSQRKQQQQPLHSTNMSHEGQEELLDYSDSEEIAVTSAVTAGEGETNDKEADKKGSYVGIHATGFRDFLLKPELLRAIGDCGFEHPSEGM